MREAIIINYWDRHFEEIESALLASIISCHYPKRMIALTAAPIKIMGLSSAHFTCKNFTLSAGGLVTQLPGCQYLRVWFLWKLNAHFSSEIRVKECPARINFKNCNGRWFESISMKLWWVKLWGVADLIRHSQLINNFAWGGWNFVIAWTSSWESSSKIISLVWWLLSQNR